jgi:excinuclease ABC subunit A
VHLQKVFERWGQAERIAERTLQAPPGVPVGSLVVSPAHEAELRELLAKALDVGKGVLHLLAPLNGLAEAMDAGTPTTAIGTYSMAPTDVLATVGVMCTLR